jgi:aquaporin NIP
MFAKAKVAALVAEFLGTAVLSLAVLSVVLRSSFPFFPAIVAGLAVGIMILVVGKASGGHFNPAITLGLWSVRKVQTAQALVYVAAQLLGGLAAWKLTEYLIGRSTDHIADWGLNKGVLVAEAVGTFIFGFGVAAAVNGVYEGTKLATVIGGSLALGILAASLGSNGVVNPAVALSLNSMSWAYAVGPLVGAVLGMWTHELMFAPVSTKRKNK